MPRHKYNPNINSYSPTSKPNIVRVVSHGININEKPKRVNARILDFKGKKIIGWKKAIVLNIPNSWHKRYCLVKLEIPANATRYQPRNSKCRASRAKVLAIYKVTIAGMTGKCFRDKKPDNTIIAASRRDPSFVYIAGQMLRPKSPFDKRFDRECCSGIHFFLTEEEALKFNL